MLEFHIWGEKVTIDFSPELYKTKANAAKALYKALRKLAKESGQNPDIEVSLLTPYESLQRGTGNNWRVTWDAGPYEWAIAACELVSNYPHWYTEPYYSCDLCFAD